MEKNKTKKNSWLPKGVFHKPGLMESLTDLRASSVPSMWPVWMPAGNLEQACSRAEVLKEYFQKLLYNLNNS